MSVSQIGFRYFKGRNIDHFYAASYLDISQKGLRLLQPTTTKKTIDAFITALHSQYNPPSAPNTTVSILTFEDLKHFRQQGQPLAADLATYDSLPSLAKTEPWDPLATFSARNLNLPNLTDLASRLWSIPATSGSSERVFSLMGRIDKLSHSRLTEEHFEHYTFVKANS